MKRTIIALCLLVCAGCNIDSKWPDDTPVPVNPPKAVIRERPQVNPPGPIRQENWVSNGSGSCVHASVITLLRWQGRYQMADHWRRTYGSGETADDLAAKFEKEGIRYAYTYGEYDVAFLEWACNTRRGCGVTVMGGVHMIDLVHLDDEWACLLDDNSPSTYKWVPRDRFLAEWKASNSWAVTVIYAPAAPLPQQP